MSPPPWFFSALFIPAATRFNSGVAILHFQPVQTLDAPELTPQVYSWLKEKLRGFSASSASLR